MINKCEQIEPLILIDIPIGLKNGGSGERLSDLGARRILKARKFSIFPIPCREAVYTESYKKACEVNEKLTGKRISKQTWNIVPKIRDVNNFLVENETLRTKIKEVGPEICFQVFTGLPMEYSKKSHGGSLERKKHSKIFACLQTKLSKLRFQSTGERKLQKMIFSMQL